MLVYQRVWKVSFYGNFPLPFVEETSGYPSTWTIRGKAPQISADHFPSKAMGFSPEVENNPRIIPNYHLVI